MFVTYVPARSASPRAAARSQVLARSPGVAVLAGALLAGGSAHSIAGADGFAPARRDTPVKPFVAAVKPAAPSKPDALPLLTLAIVNVEPPAAPAASRPIPAPPMAAVPPPQPVPPKPAAAPRRDLAGFLAEQGHQLAPVSEELEAAAELVNVGPLSLEADAPALSAAPVVAAGESAEAVAQQSVAQSFPILSVDGVSLGAVTMRGNTVHLAALLGLLQLRMPAEEFARLKAAPAADSFVSLSTLRDAGLAVTIDGAGERLTLAAL